MPEISRFYGIIIRIFTETGEQHHTPHIHVYYQDKKAVYSIDQIELLVGELPRRQQRLVEAWMELYQEELLENWDLALAGEPVNRVPPLQR
jgi:hypothetical protein